MKNQLGFNVLSDDTFSKIFGKEVKRSIANNHQMYDIKERLKNLDVEIPVQNLVDFEIPELPLPDIDTNIFDFLEGAATERMTPFIENIEEFVKFQLPEPPKKFILTSGWICYPHDGGSPFPVDIPPEEVMVYDTETFVQGGNFPIIGTAVGLKGYYLWLAKELLEDIPQKKWDQYNLIPVGKNKVIVAYNSSFDRIRSREAYEFSSEPDNFWLDALSMHIACNALASGQRSFYVKSKNGGTEKFYPDWLDAGTTNSLVSVYNFHVYTPKSWFDENAHEMKSQDKVLRDIFVKSETLKPIKELLEPLIGYALNDTYRTAELFQVLWPKYRKSTPTNIALSGHYYLNGSQIPISKKWEDWIDGCDKVFEEYKTELQNIVFELGNETYSKWKTLLEDDLKSLPRYNIFDSQDEFLKWINTKSSKVQELFVNKKGQWSHPLISGTTKKKFTHDDRVKLAFAEGWLPPTATEFQTSDPWISQFDWKYKLAGKEKFVPDWTKKLDNLSTRTTLTHLLLQLKWEGRPLVLKEGWGTIIDNVFTKIPHPSGNGANVGGVLTKNFIGATELSSSNLFAKRALEIANASSYWTSIQSRVKEIIYKDGLFIPDIIAHGTITRRASGSLLPTLTSTKSYRIGTELKSRIEAPEGYKMIYADFSSQEMAIAALYADHWEGGIVGASAMGHTAFNGDSSTASDAHTKLAQQVFYSPKGIFFKDGQWWKN